ncbi:MAG: AAA family ATPase [Spirochaetaceae bacterium]
MANGNPLFAPNREGAPLADRMRPRNLDEFIGQEHIIGPGRLLRRAIQADQLSSLLFSGPPGTGKTTLARVIANSTKSRFASVNAVLSGVKELRGEVAAAEEARSLYGRRTILFVDEVHRWNKAQQDALLPWVENGTLVLIGATTENPFFEVNKALVSRSRVFLLKPLSDADLHRVIDVALQDRERGYGAYSVQITREARDHLVKTAAGDARTLLNALELAVETTPERFPPPKGSTITVDLTIAEESIQQRAVLYDKEGDYHFDTISAFIKSLRGSDPDAALYWLATMVAAGEEPRFIFRRMLISASEDVGLADPNALTVVASAAAAFDRVGMPEGSFHLTHAALYLANAPKSNSALGFFDALEQLKSERSGEVPNHLRDANRDAKGFGHGEGYLYPHAYREHWVAQQYLPETLQGVLFYQPGELGWEGERREELLRRRELQLAAFRESAQGPEVLSYTPDELTDNPGRRRWERRNEENLNRRLRELREALLSRLTAPRHGRVLYCGTPADLLLWELLRRTPEGETLFVPLEETEASRVAAEAEHLEELHRPVIVRPQQLRERVDAPPEALLFLNAEPDMTRQILSLTPAPVPEAQLLLAAPLPAEGTKLSSLLASAGSPSNPAGDAEPADIGSLRAELGTVEAKLYRPTIDELETLIAAAGFSIRDAHRLERTEERRITAAHLSHWLDPSHPGYGRELRERWLGEFEERRTALLQALRNLDLEAVPWKRVDIILDCRYTSGASAPPA